MEKDIPFDLASLTKPLATTLAVMNLADRGALDLDASLSYLIKPFHWQNKAGITPRLLLSHSSGLEEWKPFYRDLVKYSPAERKPALRRMIMEKPLKKAPKKATLYSDLGFMLLEWIIEEISGKELPGFLDAAFYKLPGMQPLFLGQAPSPFAFDREIFAATEYCHWRKEIVQGHVHDENAHALGGYSGHAGLFGTAQAVFNLSNMLVKIYNGDSQGPISPRTVREFFSRQEIVPGSTWALGWDTPSRQNSSSGRLFSSQAVGHTGFTGTSIWIDLERDIKVILLTNRVHPSRSNEKIRKFRPEIHDLVMKELGYG